MNDSTNSLALAAQNAFEDCDRKELEEHAETLGVQFHPNIKDENLRDRLLENLGHAPREIPDEPTEQDHADRSSAGLPDGGRSGELSTRELFGMNLTPKGKWQGRRRVVSIQRPTESPKARAPHVLQWGKSMATIPFNKAVSIPYPFYHILKNSTFKELHQKTRVDDDGVPHKVNNYEEINRFSLTDMGDDPDTAHLPVSHKDQFRRIAEATDMLRSDDINKARLLQIARRLRLRIPRQAESGEVREVILRKIGYDTLMMDFGEDEAAA